MPREGNRPSLNAERAGPARDAAAAPVSFDRVAHAYDGTRGLPPEAEERVAEAIVEAAGATPETSFLEPGIGTGRIAMPLLRRGHRYTGVDISEKMLSELRRKLKRESEGLLNRLTLFVADATALPFADSSFDVVVSAHVLHLIPDWRGALAEVRRVLRPEGVFLYCHQEWDGQGAREVFGRRWRGILAEHGADAPLPGARRPAILNDLREQGASLETRVAARWQTATTAGSALERYEKRLHSTEWLMRDRLFESAVHELRLWAKERYPSEETPLDDTTTFKITAVSGWPICSKEEVER